MRRRSDYRVRSRNNCCICICMRQLRCTEMRNVCSASEICGDSGGRVIIDDLLTKTVADGPMMTGGGSHAPAAANSQNRLYSYMSGSDVEDDQVRPSGRRVGHGRRRGERGPAAGHGDAVDALSSCSSLSSVHSSSPSDVDHNARLAAAQPRRSVDRMTDTIDSDGRVGGNVYSRIKEPGWGCDFRRELI